MTAHFPVHREDIERLVRIRRYLIGYRVTNGWTQQELSLRINRTKTMAYNLESDLAWQWRLSRLQGWLKAFGLRLDARLVLADDQLTDEIHCHAEVAPFWHLSRQSQDLWPMWQRAYLTTALTVARKRLDVQAGEMAQRAGVTRKSVTNWENVADEVMLPKVLHYARLLGGHVELDWEE